MTNIPTIIFRALVCLCATTYAFALATGNSATQGGATSSQSPTKPTTEGFRIDSEKGGVGGIYIDMTGQELRNIKWPYKAYRQNLEADLYLVRIYRLSKDSLPNVVHLEVSFSEPISIACNCRNSDPAIGDMAYINTIYDISSHSKGVYDQYGLGVGSSLKELKQYYPKGYIFLGDPGTDYAYAANFITETRLYFSFKHSDLIASCENDNKQGCIPDENVIVQSFYIR